jgi:hypothetical protein
MKDNLYKGLVAVLVGFLSGIFYFYLTNPIWLSIILITLLPIIFLYLILIKRTTSTKEKNEDITYNDFTFGKFLFFLIMLVVVFIAFCLGLFLMELLCLFILSYYHDSNVLLLYPLLFK